MSQNNNDNLEAKREYLKILLKQYSECWAAIRNYSNSIWQIPTFLVAVISFLGLLYGNYLRDFQSGRIVTLLLAFGFSLVSFIALVKHRFFAVCRAEDFEEIQKQIKKLLGQKEFQILFNSEIKFREIKFKSKDLAEHRCFIYHTSAYRWQLGLAIAILIGIFALLLSEFVLFLVSYM